MIKIKKIFGIVFSAFLFVSLMANSPIQLLFAAAPTVITGGGTNLDKTTATLLGTITDDSGLPTSAVGFEYGTTTSYGSTVSGKPTHEFSEVFAGSPGTGNGQFDATNGPISIDMDSTGNMYVVDLGNSRVQKFDSDGNFILAFGSVGTNDSEFSTPTSVRVDSGGNVYVTDFGNHRVQKFDSSGNFLATFGWGVATGASQYEICTLGCQAGIVNSGNGGFSGPYDVDFDSAGNVYVVDALLARVQKFNSSLVFQSKFGTSGTGDGQFTEPVSVTIDSTDNIYISDNNYPNSRIQKFNSSFTFVSKTNLFSSDNFREISISSDNYVYVADTLAASVQGVRVFDSNLAYVDAFVSLSLAGEGGAGLAIDSADSLYVTDLVNSIVQKFTRSRISLDVSSLTCETTYHYRAYATNADGTSYSSDDTFTTLDCEPPILETKEVTSITKTSATIHGLQTSDGAFTPSVRGFEYGTTPAYGSSVNISPSSIMDSTQLSLNTSDSSINQDSSGNIYIAYSGENSIQIFDSSFNLLFGFGWGVETGASQFEICTSSCLAGISGTGNGQFNSPQSVAVDSSTGNIFVSDSGNNRIQIFNSSGVYQSQFGSLGSGDGQFTTPNGIQIVSVSGTPHLFVADTENNRIQKFTTSGTFVGKVGTGTQFSSPSSLAVSNAGGLYVADTGNNRIQYIDPVTLSAGAVTFILPSGQASISSPRGVAFDSSDNMYISDTGNNHIDFAIKDGVSNYRIISFYTNLPTPYDYLKEIFVANSGWGVNAGTIYFSDGHNNVIRSLNTPFMSTALSSLSCGTTYYYRPFATNSDGTGYGAEGTFTTSSCGGSTGSGGGGNNPTPGCTDPLAENYNSFADVDNGTCTYEGDIWGCVNPFATNYNILATQSDGSCVFDDIIPGPTDVPGCRDSSALNYNPSATQDNGTCTYPTVLPDPNDVFGCTDSTALNFNSAATKNDGSCEYAPGEDPVTPDDKNPGIGGGTDLPNGTSKKIIPRAFEYVIRIFEKLPTSWLKTLAEIALAVSIPLRIWNLIPAILGYRGT